ncbi:metallophosphoesterase [Phyllobacterium sp. UNC302MFCol5.2]|uniref:metallophosphoesterase n=1 Tax=Phyllobacterium sp. UNC302MFCol5.2 TaxID=1449065 RepID=UPI000487E7C4|nr:metallophosphoesterase [Phyllobacterium sp. UNC302MFCol5.2]
MAAIFVHVSDIHFGQERDHVVHIHDDVKKELISDAAEVIAGLGSGATKGILVTGDIAFSGKAEQYVAAGKWLDTLAEGIGCPIHRVQMIPGNHDMDRDKLSVGGSKLLDFIRAGGAAEYEKVIANYDDRATLFSRFEQYGRFCIGYNCGLDLEAKYATNLRIEVGPNRWLRFVRLNSSLLCHGEERDDQPELVMGERQFVIPRYAGEENVVLAHHPLNWYKDAEDVRQYVRSRARVFISGHEHDPKVDIDRVEKDCDVMMLAAGAAVPFRSNDTYTFTYNILEFDWDDVTDNLVVTIHPRAWNPLKTCFEADDRRLGGREPRFTLGSPNFKKVCSAPTAAAKEEHVGVSDSAAEPNVEMVPAEGVETSPGELVPMPPDAEGYELALLRFFRDLYESERLKILVELDALPAKSNERMNQGLERRLFDWLVRDGRLPDINSMIDRLIGERKERDV